MISSSWKDSMPSEYGKVAEIIPIVGTVGSTLVTYDNGILRTPNLLLKCSVTSSSSCMMDTSLLHARISAGSYHSSHYVVYDLNWSRIRQFRPYTTSCKEWIYPADLPACSKDVSIIQLLELVTEHLRSKLGVRVFPLFT